MTRFEAYVDDLTAEEVLEQVQVAAKAVRKRVMGRKNANKMGFLRQNKDGTTSMKMMLANSNDCPERIVSIGAFTGKLQQGTGQLQVSIIKKNIWPKIYLAECLIGRYVFGRKLLSHIFFY